MFAAMLSPSAAAAVPEDRSPRRRVAGQGKLDVIWDVLGSLRHRFETFARSRGSRAALKIPEEHTITMPNKANRGWPSTGFILALTWLFAVSLLWSSIRHKGRGLGGIRERCALRTCSPKWSTLSEGIVGGIRGVQTGPRVTAFARIHRSIPG
jgi:hypothetical protein